MPFHPLDFEAGRFRLLALALVHACLQRRGGKKVAVEKAVMLRARNRGRQLL